MPAEISQGQTALSLMWLTELFCGIDNFPESAIKAHLSAHKMQHGSASTGFMCKSWCVAALCDYVRDCTKNSKCLVLTDKPMYTPLAFLNINYVLPLTLTKGSELMYMKPHRMGTFVTGNLFLLYMFPCLWFHLGGFMSHN